MLFYGIYGINGCGIYTNEDKLDDAARYVINPHIRKFRTRGEAENYAVNGISSCHYQASFLTGLPLNFTIYQNQIEEYILSTSKQSFNE